MEFLIVVFLLLTRGAVADISDADQADSQSDTSSTSDMSSLKESVDPNLVNPQRGQGYGMEFNQQQWKTTAVPPRIPLPTTPRPSFAQESARAMLEFGIIVSSVYFYDQILCRIFSYLLHKLNLLSFVLIYASIYMLRFFYLICLRGFQRYHSWL